MDLTQIIVAQTRAQNQLHFDQRKLDDTILRRERIAARVGNLKYATQMARDTLDALLKATQLLTMR